MFSTHGKCAHSHLLYAYDNFLFCGGTSATNLRNIVATFSLYAQFSSQMVNQSKCFIYFGDVVSNVGHTALFDSSGIRLGNVPFVYMGVLLFKGRPLVSHLRSIVDSIVAQFDAWKGHFLSFSCLSCLINFVMVSKFFDYFVVYKWPATLLQRLNCAFYNYFWMGYVSQHKEVTVSWNVCCHRVSLGGIGFKNLGFFNKAFFG